jgi:spermidine dehydrogenase
VPDERGRIRCHPSEPDTTRRAPGLLRAAAPARAATKSPAFSLLGPDWTGPGGIGDYSRANGNTHEVVNAAHSIWKGDWDKPPAGAVDAGEFDLVEAT